MRRECVEIRGTLVSQVEDASQILVQVAELLDVDMGLDDISISHRLLIKVTPLDRLERQHTLTVPEHYREVC